MRYFHNPKPSVRLVVTATALHVEHRIQREIAFAPLPMAVSSLLCTWMHNSCMYFVFAVTKAAPAPWSGRSR